MSALGTLTGKSRIAGVFGWPVDHSRSPRLHGYWLKQFDIDGAYIPFATHPSKLEQGIRALPSLGFRGGNVTLPHKERALSFVDEVTLLARRIGAVNTLVVREDGSILGDNSDGFGFIANLQQLQPSWRGAAGPAVVLGAGGAARAIVVALLDEGVPEIRLVNRTTRRAEEIAEAVGGPIKVLPWEARADALKDAALLTNSTNIGMAGQAPLEIDLANLPTSALVYDIVYVPLLTELLKAAQARGNPIVDGIGMLLHQARPGFRAWFGPDPQVTAELRAFVLGQ
ncbi:shikimate dehydrogenase [Dongia deserti]|uniref:shikimate dehydrogenase n=1 Tax=Dongia deserti TaxID=2268030 RepID=UPI000E65E65B|nr:shikimate dehydrogenase [Dongia deserti]